MNNVTLLGRVTKDFAGTKTDKGLVIARNSLAVKRPIGGVDFINIVAFGKTAETLGKFVKQGHRVLIQGHIQTGSYEKENKKVYTTDVVVDRFEFIESAPKKEESQKLPF
jgi:single-strand DNA-binding protein